MVSAFENSNEHYESAIQAFTSSEIEAAYIHIKNAVEQTPNNLAVKILYAKILSDKELHEDALPVFESALDGGADPNNFVEQYINSLLAQGRYQEISEFSEFNRLSTANRYLWKLAQGRACILTADLNCAKKEYQALTEQNSERYEAYNGLALTALIENDDGASMQYAHQALAIEINPESYRILGQVYKAQQNYQKAITNLQKAFNLDPSNQSIIRNFVDLLIVQGDLDEAWRSVNSILEKTPNDLFASYTQALIANRQGKQQESEAIITSVKEQLESFPKKAFNEQPWLQYLRGMVSLLENNHAQAQETLQRYLFMVEQDPTAALYLARSYLITNKARQALSVLEPYEPQLMDNIQAIVLLGQLYASQNKVHKAIILRNELINRYPNSLEIALFDIQLKISRGNLEEAYQQLSGLSEAQQSTLQVGTIKAFLSYQLGRLEEAKSIAQGVLTLAQNNVEMLNIVAAYYIQQGNLSIASSYLDKALNVHPEHGQTLTNMANIAMQQNQLSAAEQLLTKALRNSPESLATQLLNARLLLNKNEIKQAEHSLLSLLENNKFNVDIHTMLAESYLRQQALEQSLEHVNILKGLMPNNKSLVLQSHWLQYRLGKLDSLRPILLDLDSQQFSDKDSLYLLHRLFATDNQIDKAGEALWRAASLFQNDLNVQLDLFKWLISQQRFEKAESLSNKLETRIGVWPALRFTQAELAQAKGEFQKAVALYKQTLALDDSSELALAKLFTLLGNGISRQAFQALIEPLVERHPQRYFSRNLLAQFHYYYGDRKQALRHYEILLDSGESPNPTAILNRMAQITYTEAPEQSEVYLRRGLSIDESSFALQKSMGILLVDTDRHVEGLSWLRRAQTQNSQDSFLLFYLSKALIKSKRKEDARAYLNEIIAKHQSSPSYALAKSLIQTID